MKNLCVPVTCADQGSVCYVTSKESLCFHAKKKKIIITKRKACVFFEKKLDPFFKLFKSHDES